MAKAMVTTVRPKASETPSRPIPTWGKAAARTALPHPPSTSQNVPMNSAASFLVSGMSDSCLFDLFIFKCCECLGCTAGPTTKIAESPAEVKPKAGISVLTLWTTLASAVSGRQCAHRGPWPGRRPGELFVPATDGATMLSILVCHSYYLHLDQKQVVRAKPYPPLATLQVVSMLRKAGHRVSFFDAMLADGIDEYESLLRADPPQLALFYEDNFNFLSKMCLGAMREAACAMMMSARRVGARVIAAGPDVTDAPEAYLKSGADLALLGEGLSALFEVLPRLDSNPQADNAALAGGLSGIVSVSHGKVRTKGAPGAPAVAAQVGLAAWDLVDMERYRAMWMKAHGYFSLNMAASRGCSFRCAWCAKPIWGNQYLQRQATEVAEEVAYLKRSFNPDHIWFADDIFGL